MKDKTKGFVSGVLASILISSLAGTALATVGSQMIQADYNNINVTLDGAAVELVDANGNTVEPFAVAGTTYLPVRAVASALGLEVGWDGQTNTVILAREPVKITVMGPVSGTIHVLAPDTIVYVSDKSNTIHSTSTCSGMKNYREMTAGDADAQGFRYCDHCW